MSQVQKQKPQVYAVINITEPVLQQPPNENIPAFVTYLVSGVDPHGEFNIRRRYRQFLLLRNKLVQRFIGIYIPPIPSKRAAGNTQERYVEMRRRFLQYFCFKIVQKPFLFDSDIFQTFIRGDPDYQRAVRYISSYEYALVANIYDIEYKKYVQEADMPKVLLQLQKQAQILKTIDKNLTNIRDDIVKVVDAKNTFTKDFSYVFKTVLPKFEKEFILRHDSSGQNDVMNENELLKASLEEYLHFCEDNPLEEFVEMLSYDIREARALMEAMESRKHFENKKNNFEIVRRQSKEELQKLKVGRTTIKSIFTSGNRQTQVKELESSIGLYERNETFLSACLPLSAISIHRDIIQYKTTRSIDYLGKLQIIARKQMRLLDYYSNFLIFGLPKKQ